MIPPKERFSSAPTKTKSKCCNGPYLVAFERLIYDTKQDLDRLFGFAAVIYTYSSSIIIHSCIVFVLREAKE